MIVTRPIVGLKGKVDRKTNLVAIGSEKEMVEVSGQLLGNLNFAVSSTVEFKRQYLWKLVQIGGWRLDKYRAVADRSRRSTITIWYEANHRETANLIARFLRFLADS